MYARRRAQQTADFDPLECRSEQRRYAAADVARPRIPRRAYKLCPTPHLAYVLYGRPLM
jgi:hypothetical protein